MRLFLVWDSEGVSTKTDSVIEDLFTACDDDSEEPQKRKRKSVKRKKEPKSVSEDEDEDDMDDDDDDGSEESAASSPKKAPEIQTCSILGSPSTCFTSHRLTLKARSQAFNQYDQYNTHVIS